MLKIDIKIRTDFSVAVSFGLILSPVLRTEMSPNFFMLKIAAFVLFDTCVQKLI